MNHMEYLENYLPPHLHTTLTDDKNLLSYARHLNNSTLIPNLHNIILFSK